MNHKEVKQFYLKKKKKVFYRVFSSFPKLEKHEMLYIGGKSKTKNVKKKHLPNRAQMMQLFFIWKILCFKSFLEKDAKYKKITYHLRGIESNLQGQI